MAEIGEAMPGEVGGEMGAEEGYGEAGAEQVQYAEGQYAEDPNAGYEGEYYQPQEGYGEAEAGVVEGGEGMEGEMQQGEMPAEIDDAEPAKKRGGHGRRKIEIEYIDDKIRRHITFSKRKAGISKKAYELSRLTGAQVLLLISSERGQIYSFATPKLQPILVNEASKTLIEQCLNAPDPIAPLALGMPGMPQAMLPIEGDPNADPNDPNAQYGEYAPGMEPQYQAADGSAIDPAQADADQLLAMQQAHYQGYQEGMEYPPGMEQYQQQQYAEQYEQQYAEGYAQEGYEQQYEQQEGYEGQEGYEQQYEQQEGYEGYEQQEGYEGQEQAEEGEA